MFEEEAREARFEMRVPGSSAPLILTKYAPGVISAVPKVEGANIMSARPAPWAPTCNEVVCRVRGGAELLSSGLTNGEWRRAIGIR